MRNHISNIFAKLLVRQAETIVRARGAGLGTGTNFTETDVPTQLNRASGSVPTLDDRVVR